MANPLTSVLGDVHWNGSQVAHAKGWTINPVNNASTYSSNLTKGKVNRRPGNYDATGTFTLMTTDGDIPGYPGQIAALKLYVNATVFWHIQNAIILSADEMTDLQTNETLGWTINWAFAGKDDGSGGSITAPDGTVLDRLIAGEVAEG